MSTDIKITVVTPSYNQGKFIERTILSVLNQTYRNIEYIIIDGGSTDETMEIVNRYRGRIDVIVHEKDKGQSDAINKGFKLATGTLVGWLNSDDVLYPDAIERIASLYREDPSAAIYYGATLDYIDSDDHLLHSRTSIIPNKAYLLNTNYDVIQQGSFYNAEIVRKVNYVDESIYYCMDLELWLRLLDHGSIVAYKGKSIAAIRRWEDAKTSLGGHKFVKNIEEVLRKYKAKKFSRTFYRIQYMKLMFTTKKLLRYKYTG